MVFLWFVTIVGTVAGALLVASSFGPGNSAPQQAALAAIGVGCAVIPYVFTRACEGISIGTWQRRLIDAVEGNKPPPRPLTTPPYDESVVEGFITKIRAKGATVARAENHWIITPVDGKPVKAFTQEDMRRWAERLG